MLVYLCLGSNLGNPQEHLRQAREEIRSISGVKITASSRVIETEPYGLTDQPIFLNQILVLETELGCMELLSLLQDIENRMGRQRDVRWGPRIIDIDILLAGEVVIDETNLQVPHPELHKRQFVLKLLSELIPTAVHPVLGLSIAQLYDALDN